jgi:DNA-binding GntR family transcriptional regulator
MTLTDLSKEKDDTTVSFAERAYQLLIRKITRLELAPGTVLVEKDLMAKLEIGRTPIREALQRIAKEGLIQHLPNRGMLVSDLGASDVQSIYEFRSLIQGAAVRLAAVRATEEDKYNLKALDTKLKQATSEFDINSFVALDLRFYESIGQASKNVYLQETLPRIFNLHLRLQFYISRKTEVWHTVARSHNDMTSGVVAAVQAGLPDKAEEIMTSHITRRHQEIKALL